MATKKTKFVAINADDGNKVSGVYETLSEAENNCYTGEVILEVVNFYDLKVKGSLGKLSSLEDLVD